MSISPVSPVAVFAAGSIARFVVGASRLLGELPVWRFLRAAIFDVSRSSLLLSVAASNPTFNPDSAKARSRLTPRWASPVAYCRA